MRAGLSPTFVLVSVIFAGWSIVSRCGASGALEKECWVYLGTYTGRGSEGIYVATLDMDSGLLSQPRLAAAVRNPSFLALHPRKACLYAVSEEGSTDGKPSGSITAFGMDIATGLLTRINGQSTAGNAPCHVAVDPSGQCVLAANYSSGSVVSCKLNSDGSLSNTISEQRHHGSSVNKSRQEKPHAHCMQVDPSGQYALAADLGTDQVVIYRLDSAAGKIERQEPAASMPPGSGPRHLAFHPHRPWVFVCQELTSKVTALHWDSQSGKLEVRQHVSSLPADFQGDNSTAEIQVHPSGKFVYVSNRGHDSIACLAVAEDGKLTLRHHCTTQGKTPRNFGIDPTGKFLVAANQDSGNVVVFRIDPESGKLTPTGSEIHVSMPVCVKFLPRR